MDRKTKANTNAKTNSSEEDFVTKLKNSFTALQDNDEAIFVKEKGESSSDLLTNEADDNDWGMNEKWKEASHSLNESDHEDVEEIILEDCHESHARDSNLVKLCFSVFKHWDWTSNGNLCFKGTRIILGWNNYDVDVSVISQSDQVIHTRIWLKLEKKELFCSFIYGHNRYTHRRALWDNLCVHKNYVRARPWCLIGDFNAALFLVDSMAGSSMVDIAMREFKECVDEIEVMDILSSGLQFTWNQKPKGFDGLLKKIDRVLVNMQLMSLFKPKPLKFSHVLTQHRRFKEVVNEGWALEVLGFCMFHLIKKLKNLKKPFLKLFYDQGNLHDNVNRLRMELDIVQADLDSDPFNVELREEEVSYVQAYNNAIIMQERFLKHKAKNLWLKEGDSNSAYFHKAVKGRVSRSRINVVTDSVGTIYENERVADAFIAHYEVFLCQEGFTLDLNTHGLFDQVLDNDMVIDMIRDVCDNEVKETMFSMGNDKSSGLDGYTKAFFKEAWDIVGNDVIKVVKEFFINGKLLKELNHTIIALIPKVHIPSLVNDYRPISCCNVLFKCISKIIANRIKGSLKLIISPNQSDFVSGHNILDNIMLTHELMHNYHLDHGVPRCAFKVDIQKAYDTVD
ncbi:hypothetical protein Tco_1159385 [Tanacetum coccineum]